MEAKLPKSTGWSKRSSRSKVHNHTCLPPETRKIQIKNLTLHLKELEKEEKTKSSQQNKGDNKDQSENK